MQKAQNQFYSTERERKSNECLSCSARITYNSTIVWGTTNMAKLSRKSRHHNSTVLCRRAAAAAKTKGEGIKWSSNVLSFIGETYECCSLSVFDSSSCVCNILAINFPSLHFRLGRPLKTCCCCCFFQPLWKRMPKTLLQLRFID